MWSIGVYDFGLSDADFWNLTPRLFHALTKRCDAAIKRSDYSFGIVASVIANAHRDTKQKPDGFTPEDFMPKYGVEAKQSPKDMQAFWEREVVPKQNAAANLKAAPDVQ